MIASLQAEEGSSEPADFDLPVPVGMPVNGIKVPQYSEDGRRLMLFEAAVAKKVDEQRVEMESLKLEALDGEGRKIFVELPQAVFNLDSRILTGDNSAKISREDFEITGDSIEFNTKTRFGTLRGNVKMVISTEGNPK
jgi:lipopolysaccharide assembly outer membrane protein LptD (OstA)